MAAFFILKKEGRPCRVRQKFFDTARICFVANGFLIHGMYLRCVRPRPLECVRPRPLDNGYPVQCSKCCVRGRFCVRAVAKLSSGRTHLYIVIYTTIGQMRPGSSHDIGGMSLGTGTHVFRVLWLSYTEMLRTLCLGLRDWDVSVCPSRVPLGRVRESPCLYACVRG